MRRLRQLAAEKAAFAGRDTAFAADLAGERAAFAARDAERLAMLTAEQAKTAQAIQAFSDLATSLDALAAERSRPWWRRLVG